MPDRLVLDSSFHDKNGNKWQFISPKYWHSKYAKKKPICKCGRKIGIGFVTGNIYTARFLCPYCVIQNVDGKMVEFDIHGRIRQLSGNEKPFHCFWCGKHLKRAGQRYCGSKCQMEYDSHYLWSYARNNALRKQGKCSDCGSTDNLMVHHVIPVRGTGYGYNPLHVPSNLMVLCPSCHGKRHAEDRKQDAVFQNPKE